MSVKTDNSQTLVNALAEIERLEGQVSELAKFVGAGDRLCYELESWLATEHDKDSVRAIKIWKRLRNQADKLEKDNDPN